MRLTSLTAILLSATGALAEGCRNVGEPYPRDVDEDEDAECANKSCHSTLTSVFWANGYANIDNFRHTQNMVVKFKGSADFLDEYWAVGGGGTCDVLLKIPVVTGITVYRLQ